MSTDQIPPETRRPTQERGQRRVEAILDATAVIVAEHGVAGATVHGIAREARTSIGSMYHFFPDLESVLRALAERHVAGIRALLQDALASGASESWGTLPLGGAVASFLHPLLDYVDAHPDMLHVLRRPGSSRDPELQSLMTELAERLVSARTPRALPTQRQLRAVMILALVDGVLTRAERAAIPAPRVLTRELERAVAAYLGSYEGI